MARWAWSAKEWRPTLAQAHVVEVRHNWVTGKAAVLVDGNPVYWRVDKFWDTGFEARFALEGSACIVRALYRTWHYEYELWLDGKLQ
jgi:hypothetical protein